MNQILSNVAVFGLIASVIVLIVTLLQCIMLFYSICNKPYSNDKFVIGWAPFVALAYLITYIIVKN